jgi:hypothetical protein
MKKLLILATMLLTFGFANAQEYSARADYQQTGTDKWYKGVIYYSKDKKGDIVLMSYSISGIEYGRGDFNPNSYPFKCGSCPKDRGVDYQYRMTAGCCGMVYFRVD